jgi:hypothetical protein
MFASIESLNPNVMSKKKKKKRTTAQSNYMKVGTKNSNFCKYENAPWD